MFALVSYSVMFRISMYMTLLKIYFFYYQKHLREERGIDSLEEEKQ
jgi:hypothetical protein